MYAKRIFKTPEGWVKQINVRDAKTGKLLDPGKPEGECLNPPPLDYVALAHTGKHPEQHFTRQRVMDGLRDGYIRLDGNTLIFDVHPEPLRYAIVRHPGTYCLHCGELVQGGSGGVQHVESKHAGEESPDARFPTGLRVAASYECVLDADQHEKYRLQNDLDHIVPKFHLKEVSHG